MLKPRFPDHWNSDDERTRATAELAYLQFLQQQDFSRCRDLLTFFAFDFFHDGLIERIRFSEDLRALTWDCQTVWIEPRDEQERIERGYLWASFRCTFEDVVWFESSAHRTDGLNDPLSNRGNVEFNGAEIDTLDDLLPFYRQCYRSYLRAHEDTLHSLLIDLHPAHGLLGLVFRTLAVIPKEPLAWEQLVKSDKYQIPWCYPSPDRLAEEVALLRTQLDLSAA